MNIWVDAQISPAIAAWLSTNFATDAVALRDLGLRDATDREIFLAARREAVIVMTKDADFINLLEELGSPPQVIWITCGNTSNARLRQILAVTLPQAIKLLESGEQMVEISQTGW
jgi:predicted nuclease of predicted toxin-antitoxin system